MPSIMGASASRSAAVSASCTVVVASGLPSPSPSFVEGGLSSCFAPVSPAPAFACLRRRPISRAFFSTASALSITLFADQVRELLVLILQIHACHVGLLSGDGGYCRQEVSRTPARQQRPRRRANVVEHAL